MKNLSVGLNIVLLIAVIVLFYLHFSSPAADSQTKAETTVVKGDGKSTVAYVNADSLFRNYEFYIDLTENFNRKRQEQESTLQSKQYEFERKYAEFQEKVSKRLVTTRQAEDMQKQLARQQEGLMQLRDQLTAEIMEAEAVMNQGLRDSIRSYLKDYNKKHNFAIIFSTAGNILYGQESLDITEVVVDGLNNRYAPKEEDENKKDDNKEAKKDEE